MTTDREQTQAQITQWALDAFGPAANTVQQRVIRLVEEAIELAQAENANPDTLHKLINHVYAKPVGKPAQEVGGVAVCLLAYCGVAQLSLVECEATEVARVLAMPIEQFRMRHAAKVLAGIAEGDVVVDTLGGV